METPVGSFFTNVHLMIPDPRRAATAVRDFAQGAGWKEVETAASVSTSKEPPPTKARPIFASESPHSTSPMAHSKSGRSYASAQLCSAR
jgi:hypothetical protein